MKQRASTLEGRREPKSSTVERNCAVLIPAAFLLIVCFLTLRCGEERVDARETIMVGGIPVTVEISDTPKERWRGLMLREKLGWNEGMLFVFDKEDTLSFWMHKTSIPLSIAFMNSNGIIIDIQEMRPFDETIHSSRGVALYALEMNIGWFEVNGVEVGDRAFIEFE